MPDLTVSVDEQQLEFLRQAAQRLGVAVEEVIRIGIDEYVVRHQRFEQATDYVLRKNAELYRRLAQ